MRRPAQRGRRAGFDVGAESSRAALAEQVAPMHGATYRPGPQLSCHNCKQRWTPNGQRPWHGYSARRLQLPPYLLNLLPKDTRLMPHVTGWWRPKHSGWWKPRNFPTTATTGAKIGGIAGVPVSQGSGISSTDRSSNSYSEGGCCALSNSHSVPAYACRHARLPHGLYSDAHQNAYGSCFHILPGMF
jgi:hypothetical protein